MCSIEEENFEKKKKKGRMDIQWMFYNCNPTFFFFIYLSFASTSWPSKKK